MTDSRPTEIGGSPLPAGLFEVSDACRRLMVSLGLLPTTRLTTLALTRVVVVRYPSAILPFVKSICCWTSSNSPSADVLASPKLIQSPNLAGPARSRDRIEDQVGRPDDAAANCGGVSSENETASYFHCSVLQGET
jgi:hypothetical protein